MVTKRYRRPAPAIPFIFLHGLAGETITTTPTAINWSHIHYKTSDFAFTDNSCRITLNRGGTGLYKIYAQVGAHRASGIAVELNISLYVNGVMCECSTAHGMMGAKEHSDATLIAAFEATAGDYIEIYVSTDAGTGETEENSSRIIIEGLPMLGWNNKAGGKSQYRERL